MLKRIHRGIDAFLARQGFHLDEVRVLIRNQGYFLFFSSALMVFSGFNIQATAFAAGVALISMNFWFLAKGLQGIVHGTDGAVSLNVIRFYARLALSGALLFGLIVWGRLPVAALLAGLSTVVMNILFWGVFRYHRQKVKEA